ncbi:hypothetical protein HMPREF9120_01671 [Neisseria sp. oral taxon 020 str. F0370]|nr:hypothetical protein HMPREF9120_01671 [Neisseria sp. oral taxon 020 str. F0370]
MASDHPQNLFYEILQIYFFDPYDLDQLFCLIHCQYLDLLVVLHE